MLHALVGRIGIVADAGSNAGELVGGHGSADTAAADQDAAVRLRLSQGQADFLGEVGIVHRGGIVGAVVPDLVTLVLDEPLDLFLETESGVVGTHGDAHPLPRLS